jgi:hypothetical protein
VAEDHAHPVDERIALDESDSGSKKLHFYFFLKNSEILKMQARNFHFVPKGAEISQKVASERWRHYSQNRSDTARRLCAIQFLKFRHAAVRIACSIFPIRNRRIPKDEQKCTFNNQ